LIADVYLKRYSEGWPLDADPTVAYAVGKHDGKWWPELSTSDLEIDSPYNLYKNEGLTPTPICNPRRESMLAVLQPASSPFYFFTARKDDSGRHLFATNNDEQNANQALIDSGEDLSDYDSAYSEYLLPVTEESTWVEPGQSIAAIWREDDPGLLPG
jgi:cell division protein YceG involved in septum cleavage